jgi:hypothetical protein
MIRRGTAGAPRVSLLGDVLTPLAAVAIGELGWRPGRVAADAAKAMSRETGAKVVSVDQLLARPDAEIVVVGTPIHRRVDDAIRLLDRGVHVVLAPGAASIDEARRLTQACDGADAMLLIGDPFPTAPAMQRWFVEVAGMGVVNHLSGVLSGDFAVTGAEPDPAVWSMIDCVRMTGQQCGWGGVSDARQSAARTNTKTESEMSVEFNFDGGRTMVVEAISRGDSSPPRWELQAASKTSSLRVSMLPTPEVELDGDALAVRQSTPSVALGVAPMFASFWNGVTAQAQPVIGADFGAWALSVHDRLTATPL